MQFLENGHLCQSSKCCELEKPENFERTGHLPNKKCHLAGFNVCLASLKTFAIRGIGPRIAQIWSI